ncbi:MAG TPA: NfeD family protein [Coriobacteriia bacterium]|nr:NfeD family protein [Coriobacteriia bacterium]
MEPTIWLWFWLVLAVVLSVAEIFTAGFFLLPFGIGAGIAALLEWIWPGSIVWQWVAFVAGSSLLLFGLRRFADKITHESPIKVGGNRLIGKHGTVLEEFEEHGRLGRVRVEREEWRADAPGFGALAPGTHIEVVSVVGTHLVVRPVKEDVADSDD